MNSDTLLHGQIHPTWIQNEVVSSQAFEIDPASLASLSFVPSEKDHQKLSVYNGDKFIAAKSYSHYTKSFISAGVLSVSCNEVHSVEELSIQEDNHPFDGHTVIDHSKVQSNAQIKKNARQLKNFASARGWTHK